ncbi:MAG: AAA family ATPase [Nitrospinota bacterium]|nr:AAA family ATPase [Nitrospinota bacterium]
MSTVKHTDYYKALGISPQASPQEVKESYLGWIRYFDYPQERPKPGLLEGSLTEQIEKVQEAYDLLSDEAKRAAYNARMHFTAESESSQPGTPSVSTPATPVQPRAVGEVEVMIARRKQSRSFLEFFGLNEKPFELTPDPNYFYLSSRHKEVLTELVIAIQENKGIVKIVGDAGTGKTTLCRSFLKELNSGIDFAYLFHPCTSAVELMQSINAEFGLPSDSTNKKDLLFHLRKFLITKTGQGRSVAVLVDEAQDLASEILEELRILSNLETEKHKLLQIILIGQPELDKTLNRPDLRQLQQRVSVQWELLPLNVEETHGYIQHRLNVAGGKGKVAFNRPAADAVFRYSNGLPRLINRLAEQTLAQAHLEGVKKIDRDVVHRAEKELGEIQPKPARTGWQKKLGAGMMVIGGLTFIAFYFYTQFPLSSDMPPPQTSLNQMIEQAPMNLAQSGKLVQSPAPKTRTLASSGNSAEQSSGLTEGTADPAGETEVPVQFTGEAELINQLATLSTGESKIEAARWVLKRWRAFKKETVTLTPKAQSILKTDYGISVFETNSNLNRLTTLNYPAMVEVNLPDGKGARYLALVGLKGNAGVFRSNETFEIPLALFESLWTHKAWVPWKNFEELPGEMKTGYKGDSAKWLQQQLSLLGYYKDQPDPKYGQRTADAVAKFQRYHNLKDHGRLDTETQMILYNRLPSYDAPKLTGG